MTQESGHWSLDTKKSGGARLAPTGLRQNAKEILISEVYWLKIPRGWALESGHKEKRKCGSKQAHLQT